MFSRKVKVSNEQVGKASILSTPVGDTAGQSIEEDFETFVGSGEYPIAEMDVIYRLHSQP